MTGTAALRDPEIHPDSGSLREAAGDSFPLWEEFLAMAQRDLGLVLEWRYYTDGNRWLGKLLQGKKNRGWASVWVGYCQATVFFLQRHREELLGLPLSVGVLESIQEASDTKKFLPVLIPLRTREDIADAVTLLRHRMATK